MSHTPGPRQSQKQQTRQSLLDAGLRLLEHQSLSSLGLREVTREAGITPSGFYRHFPDLPAYGMALVEESFGSLRTLIRAIRAEQAATDEVIDRSIGVIAWYVHEHRARLRFLVRERHGGVRAVRDAIADRIGQFADDLADDLAAQPQSVGWSPTDVRMLADLYADHTVSTVAALMEAEGDPEAERRITATARQQLRLISIGRRHWLHD
ncbi:TetR family transcriptional regulator [Streptacidiphilus sp. PB12-B1b]|uniref:TetR family transcriptional regulator n=1 Tax=Streptacidiphilus sp. PB12-B1b TaxID=2705012 RepID=UPI0015F8119B|nr:TetR family transcriptional regulator [Streptacidiphilus sp. PB12-B1b]QMU76128.1 TetR family transcriptional regulator [Streptacidiphilus sp. PB12-B1b]